MATDDWHECDVFCHEARSKNFEVHERHTAAVLP